MRQILNIFLFFIFMGMTTLSANALALSVTSPVFQANQFIPEKYTCRGENISPPLQFQAMPDNTKTLALSVFDPDAPAGIWYHWIMINLPANSTGIAENLTVLPTGAEIFANSWGKKRYDGPCPPSGTHRYVFELFALDSKLSLPASASPREILQVIQQHQLAQAQLIGLYSRTG
jgi:Raf kinase inhibitor-like YbhB/YbcL family protein